MSLYTFAWFHVNVFLHLILQKNHLGSPNPPLAWWTAPEPSIKPWEQQYNIRWQMHIFLSNLITCLAAQPYLGFSQYRINVVIILPPDSLWCHLRHYRQKTCDNKCFIWSEVIPSCSVHLPLSSLDSLILWCDASWSTYVSPTVWIAPLMNGDIGLWLSFDDSRESFGRTTFLNLGKLWHEAATSRIWPWWSLICVKKKVGSLSDIFSLTEVRHCSGHVQYTVVFSSMCYVQWNVLCYPSWLNCIIIPPRLYKRILMQISSLSWYSDKPSELSLLEANT